MTVDTVPCDGRVWCTLRWELTAECPHKPEQDRYEVVVRWQPDGETYEKHALASHLNDYTGTEASQEELTADLYRSLTDASVQGLSVTLKDIEHMEMTVTKP